MATPSLPSAQVAPAQEEAHIASTPLELHSLPPENNHSSNNNNNNTAIINEPTTQTATRRSVEGMPMGPARTDTTTALAQAINPPPAETIPSIPTAPATRDRAYSSAIGPSTDSPSIPPKDPEIAGPVLLITLLLTNGARHPYRLDPSYLKRRNANVQNDDPYNLSVYKLKELILRDWRDEWEQKPSSPSAIRLISFGKLLEDKSALKELKFSHDGANVVHMTIKPQDFVEEEDAKGSKGVKAHRDDGMERTPGCRCIIM